LMAKAAAQTRKRKPQKRRSPKWCARNMPLGCRQAGPWEKRAVTRRDRAVSAKTHPKRKYAPCLHLPGQPDHYASGRWDWVQVYFLTAWSQTVTPRPFTSGCSRCRKGRVPHMSI
jgi:hypothetical protein